MNVTNSPETNANTKCLSARAINDRPYKRIDSLYINH